MSKTPDFKEFTQVDSSSVARPELWQKIESQILATKPKLGQVVFHLTLIHFVCSLLSLVACPQFGVRLFFDGHGLMHYFMSFAGPVYCQFFCGAFYLGLTFLAAKFWLSYDEWLVIKKNRWLSSAVLASASLAAFAIHDHGFELQLAAVWLVGAVLAGVVTTLPTTKIIFYLRQAAKSAR